MAKIVMMGFLKGLFYSITPSEKICIFFKYVILFYYAAALVHCIEPII